MLANAFFQEVRHLEVRITEQGWDAHDWGKHLCKESATTVAYEQVGLLLVNVRAYVLQCLNLTLCGRASA